MNYIELKSTITIYLTFKIIAALREENIFHGKEVEKNEYTYHVTVIVDDRLCGGGILDDMHAVTAANCIYDKNGDPPNDVNIIGGVQNFLLDYSKDRFERRIKTVYVPKSYDHSERIESEYTVGDIAVLQFKRSLNSSRINYNTLILPTEEDYSDYIAIVTGSGSTVDQTNLNRVPVEDRAWYKLRSGKSLILSLNKCKKVIPEDKSPSLICAQMTERSIFPRRNFGACNGDIGAPLVCNDNVLVGILSVPTANCNEHLAPAVYTNVVYMKNFIEMALDDKCSKSLMFCHRY